MVYDYDLIVIGGGMSGYTLAKNAARIGVKVLLVEEKMLGGSELFYGGVPFTSLSRASKEIFRCNNAEEYGLDSMRQTADWKKLKQRIQEVQEQIFLLYDPQELRAIGCDMVFAKGSFVDQYHVHLQLNQEMKVYQPAAMDMTIKQMKVAGKKIVIATGGTPFIPDIKGISDTGFIVPQQLYELEIMPASIAIIGTDYRRIEFAQMLARLGSHVTLFSEESVLMPSEDTYVNIKIEELLEKEGISVVKGVVVEEVRGTPMGEKQVFYSDAGILHTLDVSEVMIAYGNVPNVASLELQNAGVLANENGIIVDKKLQTTNKRIFSIGDVNGEDASNPHKALYEAEFLFQTQLLHASIKRDYRSQGSTLFLDPSFARVGYCEYELKDKKIKYDKVSIELGSLERAIGDNVQRGFMTIFVSKDKKPLGVQIFAPRAEDLIREWQLALQKNLSIADIASTPYFMATYGALSQKIAKRYMHDVAYSKGFKRILSLLFGYRGR